MPTRCVAAGCDSVSGKGHSLHGFPKNEAIRKQWVRAVKRQRSNWTGPSSSSALCSKHFTADCFATEGVRYREDMGIPVLKRLKPGAIPTIFPRSVDYLEASSSSSLSTSRTVAAKRQQKSVTQIIQ